MMFEDNYIPVLRKAFEENDEVTVNVMDMSEDDFDLEGSRNVEEIVEACEATDSPVLCFYLGKESLGNVSVLVGYGDESIADHHSNEYMENLMVDAY